MSAATVDSDGPSKILADFSCLMEPFPDAIFGMTVEGIIVSWNRGAESIFGYSSREISGSHLIRLAPPERHHEVPILLEGPSSGTPFHPAPTEVVTKDGRRITVCLSASPLTDCGGAVVGIAAIARDITEKKEKERALRHSEERFRAIFSLAALGIAEVALDGRWLHANQKLCDILGYSCEELATLRIQEVSHPEDVAAHRPLLDTLLAGTIESFSTEKRCYHRDGTLLWVHLNVSLVRDGSGEPAHFIAVVEDITSARALQEELRQSMDLLEKRVAERTLELTQTIETLQGEIAQRESLSRSLETRMAELLETQSELREKEELLLQQSRLAVMGEMIGNIAHQWRQPLNTLGLLTQDIGLTCRTGGGDPDTIDATVRKSMRVIEHMAQTIDDFRNFFRPDKERVPFRLSHVVEKTRSLLEESFSTQRITIEVQVTDDPVVTSYPNECCQVLLNLLINAKDTLEERKVRDPKVVITVGSEEGKGVLTVTDNAGGIRDEIIERIFERNFTTKGPEKGTGVGLFMSRMMVERNMEGKLSVCNVGTGARFTIEFPATG
ncbi:PAS domain S-box protein [Geomonas sp. RF6]|uniref:PAS domain S-box protein n=1 Tax=Geomonas sp. RF6 TaxID=2897342 RepID=UPI001E31877E|nr:PAS domain S-box protein [Geomonas sp. RF6]UFS71127.1 PAS domain S-box protein [Geomonas sp. RF6]